MVQRVQTLRSTVTGARPSGRSPGELYVNFPDKQIGVADMGGTPQDLIPIRYFSPSANYAMRDLVMYDGRIYRSVVAVTAGPWNLTQWTPITSASIVSTGVALFEQTRDYKQNDVVVHDGKLYRANSAVAAAAWSAAKWETLTADPATPTAAGTVLGLTEASNAALGDHALNAATPGTDNAAVGFNALTVNTGNMNTAVGSEALGANTSGAMNTAVGRWALKTNDSGINNTAVGANSLRLSTGSANTAVGRDALGTNTADNNTAVGASALNSNTTGTPNTAVGYNALAANDVGTNNVAVGDNALMANTGNGNTGIGSGALSANTTANNLTAVGRNALGANTSGYGNSCLGFNSLAKNTTGNFNVAIGNGALSENISGQENTAVGNAALTANTASNNTAIGNGALTNNVTGTNNVAVGDSALVANTAGYNTAVGSRSLPANTSGASNSAFGNFALFNNTTGNDNIGLGYGAGRAITTGSGNVVIGQVGGEAAMDNTVIIADGVGNEKCRFDGSGRFMLGATSPHGKARIVGGSGDGLAVSTDGAGNSAIWCHRINDGIAIYFDNNGVEAGKIQLNGGATNYATSSDYRLKENIAPLTGAASRFRSLKPSTWVWKADGTHGEGFIAHELQEHVPLAVTGEKDGEKMQSVDYGKLTPLLTAALQEALDKIDALEARLAKLEGK